MDQIFYLKNLEELDLSVTFSQFRSIRMKVVWPTNTRPGMQFEISQLAQVILDRFNQDAKAHLKRLNNIVR